MTDETYRHVLERWNKTRELPEQRLGPFTDAYHRVAFRLKIMPWVIFGIGALVVIVIIKLGLHFSLTSITSILQRGF